MLTSDLVNTDVALVAEHHLVVVLPVGGPADVTHHVLVVLDAEPLLRLHGVRHVFVAAPLKLLHHALHGDLVKRRHGWKEGSEKLTILKTLNHLFNFHISVPIEVLCLCRRFPVGWRLLTRLEAAGIKRRPTAAVPNADR